MKKLAFALSFGILAAACAQPPVQEIAAAQAAINAAVQAGAEDYAIDDLRSSRDTLTMANTEVEAKAYKDAKVSALDAKAKAEAALAAVEVGKAHAKAKAEAGITTVQTILVDVNTLLANPKLKGTSPLKDAAKEMGSQVDLMKTSYDAGKYKVVCDNISALQNLVTDLKARAEEASKKAPAKKKKK
jgi:hypothetical protein